MGGFAFKALALAVLAVFIGIASPAFAEDEGQAKVTDIQVAGNKKIETETIRSKITTKVGDIFTPSKVRDDIAAIYKMGYFDDVKVAAEGYAGGLRLIYTVVERPIITSFSFEGNKNIETSKIREKMTISPYSVYNPALIDENVEKIKVFYQGEGYYNVKVMPVIKKTAREIKVIFDIDEGGKVIISRIDIVGNKHISSRKIRKVMETKRHIFLWSWIMKTGTYKLVEFTQDLERIKDLYYNNGYIQVQIGEPQVVLSKDKKRLSITIPITEGEQFRYGKIDVSGNKIFTSQELLKNIKAKTGDIMDRDQLKGDVVTLTDMYGSKGYAFASISPVIKPDVEKRTVDISLEVSEGDQIFVNRINISGNTKTRDKVIRRELTFNEGEIYDTTSMKRSYERLKNLDFFEDVEIVPERKGEKDTVDLDVKVKEKSTGSFSIGGGYSTVDRLVALGEIQQNNLFGLGESIRFKGEFGKIHQNYVLSFTEPWLFDRPISLRLDAFKDDQAYSGYSKKSTGGAISLGRRFWDYWGVTGTYSYEDATYRDLESSFSGFPELPDLLKLHTTSKVGFNISRDSRDNYLDPRRGSSHSVYAEYAGKYLGSENEFYKVIADTAWYFPFYWDTAFMLHGRIGLEEGMDGKDVPIYERFYVGGIGTVRGANFGDLGPKFHGSAVGGTKEIIMNAEYTFPLVPAIKLRGVTFFDAGRAYGITYSDITDSTGAIVGYHKDYSMNDFGSLEYSAGAGIRWISPLGLIRLEYGYLINPKPDQKHGKFEFSMGTMF